MCGIAGLVLPGFSAESLAAAVQRMADALQHRGPDGEGVHVDAALHCGLGHRRLSIIDLTTAGSQPMHGAQSRCVISLNGEIYNFQALRKELEQLGRVFNSRSDTEVALAAYEYWGVAAFARFNGMFAIALLDVRARKLVLARDHLGIKPLFIARGANGVGFASEIKSLAACRCFDIAPDFSALHEYLYFGNTLGTGTMLSNVQRVPPGSWLEIDLSSGEVGQPVSYWSVNTPCTSATENMIAHTQDLLAAAVQRQLVSDVPVGVFLSGGVDSTALVALASRHYGGRLRTYSVGFDYVGDGAELPKARRVAIEHGTEHHELHVGADRITDVVERMVDAHDQPFGDAANLPLYQLCMALNGATKVVLQGDGGDELFGGYRRYEYMGVPRQLVALMGAAIGALPRRSARFDGGQRFFHALAQQQMAERFGLLLTVEGPFNPPARVLSAEARRWLVRQDPFKRYREVVALLPHDTALQSMLRTDMQILLPDIFLEKVDRSTMAAGIEVRVPFLDIDLVDYVLGLPSRVKVRFGQRKKLLRAALRGIVADDILDAPKVGFGVPVSAWMAGPMRAYAQDAIRTAQQITPLFDLQQIDAMFAEHAEFADRSGSSRDFGPLLWKVMQLALWISRAPLARYAHD